MCFSVRLYAVEPKLRCYHRRSIKLEWSRECFYLSGVALLTWVSSSSSAGQYERIKKYCIYIYNTIPAVCGNVCWRSRRRHTHKCRMKLLFSFIYMHLSISERRKRAAQNKRLKRILSLSLARRIRRAEYV